MRRACLLCLFGVAVVMSNASARAQTAPAFPDRPIRMVVPYALVEPRTRRAGCWPVPWASSRGICVPALSWPILPLLQGGRAAP